MKIIKKILSALLTGAIMLSTICAGTISAGAEKVSPFGIAVTESEDSINYGVFLSEEQQKIWSNPNSYNKTCKDGHAYGLRIDLIFWDGKNEYAMGFIRFKNAIGRIFTENGMAINDTGLEADIYKKGIILSLPLNSPYTEKIKNCEYILSSNVMMYASIESNCAPISAEKGIDTLYYAPVSYVQYLDLVLEPNNANDLTADSVKVSDISDKAYTGKRIEPSITVRDGGKELVKGSDYIVLYNYNKDIGSAVVTITGIGNYSGVKNVNFDIVPKKTTLKAKKSGNTKAKLSWTGVEGAEKYQIYCSTDGKSYKRLATVSGDKTSYTASKLNFKKHDYKFKVRSYKTVDGIKYYSSFSKVKTLK